MQTKAGDCVCLLMVCVFVFLHIQELAIAIRVLVLLALPERLQTSRILTVQYLLITASISPQLT